MYIMATLTQNDLDLQVEADAKFYSNKIKAIIAGDSARIAAITRALANSTGNVLASKLTESALTGKWTYGMSRSANSQLNRLQAKLKTPDAERMMISHDKKTDIVTWKKAGAKKPDTKCAFMAAAHAFKSSEAFTPANIEIAIRLLDGMTKGITEQ
jgi:hypothetical protein